MQLSLKTALICAASATIPYLAFSLLVTRTNSAKASARAREVLETQSRVAESLYQKRVQEMRATAEGLAAEISHRGLMSDGAARAQLQDLLGKSRDGFSLDFVLITDPSGRVIARQNEVPAAGESVVQGGYKNTVAERVLTESINRRPMAVAAVAIEDGEFLHRMWLDSAARVSGSAIETALIIEGGAPVTAPGRVDGMVLIGQMLNNYYIGQPGATGLKLPLVTEVRQEFHAEGPADSDSSGSGAMVALGDTVIASSIRNGQAAQPVLLGQKRAAEMKAGTESFATEWIPIKGLDGADLGAIGVAAPSSLFRTLDGSSIAILLVGALACLIISGLVGFLFGTALSMRIKALSNATGRMSLGELGMPIRDPATPTVSGLPGKILSEILSKDEIDEMAVRLDQMRESFRQAIERMKRR